jgi:hypothetical protein
MINRWIRLVHGLSGIEAFAEECDSLLHKDIYEALQRVPTVGEFQLLVIIRMGGSDTDVSSKRDLRFLNGDAGCKPCGSPSKRSGSDSCLGIQEFQLSLLSSRRCQYENLHEEGCRWKDNGMD